MGHIRFSTRAQLLGTVGEVVGYKAGLALDQDELVSHAPAYGEKLSGSLELPVRLHSVEYEELIVEILHGLGCLETNSTDHIGIRMLAKYRGDSERQEILNVLKEEYVQCVRDHFLSSEAERRRPIDPTRLLTRASQFGRQGLDMAMELIEGANRDVRDSPHGPLRRTEWADTLEQVKPIVNDWEALERENARLCRAMQCARERGRVNLQDLMRRARSLKQMDIFR